MGWQDVAVWIVVLSAVLFLVGRNVTLKRRQKKPAQTFIPFASLKRRPASHDRGDDGACH